MDFTTYHKFRNGEEVVYNPNAQRVVGGLSTSATYFAEVVDATTIKLHDNLENAIVGINTVVLIVLWYWKTYFRVRIPECLLSTQ